MKSGLRILVSGGTGFLGSYVVPALESSDEVASVTLLTRRAPEGKSRYLKADLAQWNGGLDPESLRGRFDVFLHMAALYDLRVGASEAYRQNVAGTHSALAIAQKAGIRHFVHISTVAVAIGDPVSPYPVDRLTLERTPSGDFSDAYARTKAQAELMVRGWEHEFHSRLILRLGILVGDRDGKVPPRLDGPYHAMRAFDRLAPTLRNMVGSIPVIGHPDRSRLPLIPVDVAAQAVLRLLLHQIRSGEKGTRCYHVVPDAGGVSARELYAFIMEKVGLDNRPLRFLEKYPEQIEELLVGIPREELAYLLKLPVFDSATTEAVLGRGWCPAFREYQDMLWKGYEGL